MNGRRGHLGQPAGAIGDELLDLVESAAAPESIGAWPPEVQRHVAQLRADRAALQDLGECPAPAGLVVAAQRVAERRALLAMEGEAEGRLAVSSVPASRRWAITSYFADRTSRRLAMAAALALVGAGAVLLTTNRTPGPTPTVTAIHSDDGRVPAEPIARPPELSVATDSPEPDPLLEALSHSGESLAESVASAATVAATEAPGSAPMALDRALRLAREGRLALRITAADASRAELRLDRMSLRGRAEDGWRVAGIAPAGAVPTITFVSPTPAGPDPLVLADAGPHAPDAPGIGSRPLPPLPTRERPPGMVYFAEVRLDEGSLAAMLSAVSGRPGEAARFEELAAPVQPQRPALALDAVLWWTQPTEAWEFWARIPVAVERP